MPAVVDTVLQRGEFLTAYTPYQPEMSQGVLQAIFEYQTAICELTGMDVSNASGLRRHDRRRRRLLHREARDRPLEDRLTEATNPQVRQVVKTYAPGFGLEVVEVPHDGGTTDPDELAAAAEDAAAVIFQQPNFFGCLEPAPELAAAANDAGALPVAHVDPLSLGVLEAPGNYGCALAIGEGQGAGNFPSLRRPALRVPRVRGPSSSGACPDGSSARRQTPRASAAMSSPCRRASSTSGARRRRRTSRRTRRSWRSAGSSTSRGSGPQGLRELGETCLSLAAYAKQQLVERGLELVFPDQATFKEFAVRVGRNARDVVTAARERGVHPGYALGRDYEGMDDVLLVAVTEKRTPADIDRLADVLAEVAT